MTECTITYCGDFTVTILAIIVRTAHTAEIDSCEIGLRNIR